MIKNSNESIFYTKTVLSETEHYFQIDKLAIVWTI